MSDMLHSEMVRRAHDSAERLLRFVGWMDAADADENLRAMRSGVDDLYDEVTEERLVTSPSRPEAEPPEEGVDALRSWLMELIAREHVIVPDEMVQELDELREMRRFEIEGDYELP